MSHFSSFTFPPEIVLDVLTKAHPIDVSSFAQTCRAYRDVVYGTTDQQLWRDLYLTQPLDDLRECITVLGKPLVGSDAEIDWRTELQNFARAERCIKSLNETVGIAQVLETLFRLAITFVPSERGRSQNHIWLHDNLCDGAFIAFARVCADVREPAMRLHTLIGLTKQDYAFAIRARSRAYTYNLAHYTEDTHWGPFKDAHATTTNWLVLQPVHHLICMHVRESTDLGDEKPPNIFSLQGSALSAPDFDGDWIGISGLWHVSFAFCDHRELIAYNRFNFVPGVEQDTTMFENPSFTEVFRSLSFQLRVVEVQDAPHLSSAPIIRFVGEMEYGVAMMEGTAKLMADGNVHWSFCSGQAGHLIWSSEGVQIGSVHGPSGVFGTWSTTEHDEQDPAGPFWLRRAQHTRTHHAF